MAYIFQTLARKAAKSFLEGAVGQTGARAIMAGIKEATTTPKQSQEWLREAAGRVTRANPQRMMDTGDVSRTLNANSIGRMFMYFYDPKLKEILPYYDKFPLIILVDIQSDGFHGLNLHYLPPMLRARLMDALYTLRNNDKYDDSTKLNISYQILSRASKFEYFKPCFKKYLFSHVQSGFLNVHTEDWDKALMLPTERFAKARKSRVFADSQNMV